MEIPSRPMRFVRALGLISLLLLVVQCDKSKLSRYRAEKLLNQYLSTHPPYEDVPLDYETYATYAAEVGPEIIRREEKYLAKLETSGLLKDLHLKSRGLPVGPHGEYKAKFGLSLSEKAYPHVLEISEREARFIGFSNDQIARVALAKPKVISVSGITEPASSFGEVHCSVEFEYSYSDVTSFGELILPPEEVARIRKAVARFVLYDDGWRVNSKMDL